jgi:hypothetical protein
MLRRLALTTMMTAMIAAAIAQPALAAGQGSGSDQPATPASVVPPQQPPQAGLVWAYLPTKAFHRATSRYYGKTANGQWMTEADAKAKGFRLAGSPGTPEKPVAGTIKPGVSAKPPASKPKPAANAKKPAAPKGVAAKGVAAKKPVPAKAAKPPAHGPGQKPVPAKPAGTRPAPH